jgi:hypothetical protein
MSSAIISEADAECKRVERIGNERGRSSDVEPKIRCPTNDLQKAVEVGCLGQVAIHVKVVRIANVFLRIGRTQNRDGDEAEIGLGLDLTEKIAGTRFGKVQVKEYETRTRGGDEASLAAQETQSLFTVDGYMNVDRWLERPERFLHKTDVGGVILDD